MNTWKREYTRGTTSSTGTTSSSHSGLGRQSPRGGSGAVSLWWSSRAPPRRVQESWGFAAGFTGSSWRRPAVRSGSPAPQGTPHCLGAGSQSGGGVPRPPVLRPIHPAATSVRYSDTAHPQTWGPRVLHKERIKWIASQKRVVGLRCHPLSPHTGRRRPPRVNEVVTQ